MGLTAAAAAIGCGETNSGETPLARFGDVSGRWNIHDGHERRAVAEREGERIVHRASQRMRAWWYLGQKWLSARLTEPTPVAPALKSRMPSRDRILADRDALLEEDWRNIAAGHYGLPESILPRPLASLRSAARYFADLQRVEARRRARRHAEVRRSGADGQYPPYYLQNFHYQTDGYLSRRSAELYDHQVEVLFGGAAELMRRQALVPLRRLMLQRGVRRTRLLDVACGTGRFLREVKHNYPLLPVTGLDLSPPYLERARTMLAPWPGARLVAAPAEAMPFPDAGFDVVTCIYLFHELPKEVRRAVAKEMARLLRTGGALIFVDSIQVGDEPAFDALLKHFPRAFHEPYYAGYLREDLAALFASAGLHLVDWRRAHFSKVMTFRKHRKRSSRADAAQGGRKR